MPSGTRSLQLQFAGLYFGGSDEILYEYRLKGHDTGWIRTDNNFRISYQNLPAGTYTFQARAVDRFGRIAGELKEIPVSVSPAFWQTGWFLVLCIPGSTGGSSWNHSFTTTETERRRTVE
ncbi:MAG: hypothetical protein IPK57_13680 [Chitinophagaceae bacterium]|nr:hypothetical protein [Chitinophagaceae bacterium]